MWVSFLFNKIEKRREIKVRYNIQLRARIVMDNIVISM